MLDQWYNLNCCFLAVVISDLCLFRDNISLNPQFKFSKNLMSCSIYNVALLTFLAHNKSSSTSQLIKGKSSDFFMKSLDLPLINCESRCLRSRC